MKKHKNRKEEEMAKTTKQHEKKPYVQPKLTGYGSVEKLTQGATGTQRDAATKRP